MSVSVDVFSDFICPWCYVGGARLLQARRILEDRHRWSTSVRYRAFELNPDMPLDGLDRKRYRSAKFGSWERSQKLDAVTVTASLRDGVDWDYSAMKRTPSTRRAHRLMKLVEARDPGLNEVLASRLLRAYFAEGKDIGDPTVLVDIAAGVGVPATVDQLDGQDVDHLVEVDVEAARQRGVTGVPFAVVADSAVPGAASIEQYVALLEAAHADQGPDSQ